MANVMKNFVSELAKKQKINNFTVEMAEKTLKGSTSSVGLAKVKTNKGEVKLDLAVKGAPKIESYANEEVVYKDIFSKLREFQQKSNITKSVLPVPKFYGSQTADNMKLIAMENLESQGFVVSQRAIADEDQTIKVLQEMGKVHGTSFAFKKYKPDVQIKQKELFEVTEGDFAEYRKRKNLTGHQFVSKLATAQVQAAMEAKEPTNQEKDILNCEMFKKCEYLLKDISMYNGKYSCLVHGSAVMTNMMFKYSNDNKLEDMRFIDWKRSSFSTPVYDLSYFLYSATPTTALRKKTMDDYLQAYYDSLASTMKEFGQDPEEAMPMWALRADWEKYHKAGLMGSLLVFTNYIHKGRDIVAQIEDKTEHEIGKYMISAMECAHADRIEKVARELTNLGSVNRLQ